MHGQGKFLRNNKNAQSKSNNMSCEICGRSNCCKAFHSRESVDEFDSIADGIKDRMRKNLVYSIDRIKNKEDVNGDDYVKLSEVIDIIESY